MKKQAIWVIVALVAALVVVGAYFGFQQTTEEEDTGISFTGSKDVGKAIGNSTDANSFDDLELNPFEDNEK